MLFKTNASKSILDILEHDEKYQGKEIISGRQLLDMCQRRYLLMQEILTPVILYLQDKMNIQRIYFQSNILDMDIVMVIDYLIDDKRGYLTLGSSDIIDGLQIVSGLSNGMGEKIVKDKSKLFLDTLNEGLDNSFNHEHIILSTSHLFQIGLNNDNLNISGNFKSLDDTFAMNYAYQKIIDLNNFLCKTNFSNVKEYLENLENLKSFLEHLKIYEKDVPKVLIKK